MIPYALKRSLKQGISAAARVFRSRAPRTVVLCYHSVSDTPSFMSITPDAFRRQVLWLKERGFAFLTLAQLAAGLDQPPPDRPRAVLSFDDGFADNLTVAAPILNELGATATVFVTTGLVTGDPAVVDPMRRLTGYDAPFLTPAQVRELDAAGIEIGAHTHTHSNLALLNDAQLATELEHPRRWLEQTIGHAVTSFAYPFGKRHLNYTPHSLERVQAAGYHCAAAVAFRGVRAGDRDRRFELPRLFVLPEDSMDTFAQKVLGDFDWLAAWQHATPRFAKAILSPRDKYPYVIDAAPPAEPANAG